MKKKMLFCALVLLGLQQGWADTTLRQTVRGEKTAVTDKPTVVTLKKTMSVVAATVVVDGSEVPCQLDDLDGDGSNDELVFLTSHRAGQDLKAVITLKEQGTQKTYAPRVYAEMLLKHPKQKSQNGQNTYISSLTVDGKANPYECLQHHGAAFETELTAYRIYFDHRQTVDIYGKYRQGLELRQTQFYPDSKQKAEGYGDDILWVGNTLGLGTLRGWDGKLPQMITDVDRRTQRVLASGPLRTVVEVVDERWTPAPGLLPLTATIRYTLWAGHRECEVAVLFDRDASAYEFCTGIIHVKGATDFTDGQGTRACWGTDWPVSEKDSAGHKRETVGLGICVPQRFFVRDLPADADNYGMVVRPVGRQLNYVITFCSDNERGFGFHSAEAWFEEMRALRKTISRAGR